MSFSRLFQTALACGLLLAPFTVTGQQQPTATTEVRGYGDAELKRLNDLAKTRYFQADFSGALALWQQGLSLAKRLDDSIFVAKFTTNIGAAYEGLGQYRAALEHFRQALAIDRSSGNQTGEAALLNNIGNIHAKLGRNRQALDYYGQALAMRREIGDRGGEGTVLTNVGIVYSKLGQYPAALEHFRQALLTHRGSGDRRSESSTLSSVGVVHDNLGQYQTALEHYRQALAIDRDIGERRGEANNLSNIGIVYENLGQHRPALEHLRQALTIRREIGDRRGEADNLSSIGVSYDGLGQYQGAVDQYLQALAIRREIGDRGGEGNDLTNIGMAYQGVGHHQSALEHYRQALAIHRETGERGSEAIDLANISSAYSHLDQHSIALEHLGLALEIQSQVGAPESLWRIWNGLSDALAKLEHWEAAIFAGKQAVNTLQEMRAHIRSMEKQLQQSFLVDKEEVYRNLADRLIDRGRLPEAQQVLAMLREEEYFDFVRRNAGRGDPRTTAAVCNGQERPWCERYAAINGQLTALGREYETLQQRLGDGSLDQPERLRLRRIKADLKVARNTFRAYWQELLAELRAEGRETQILDGQLAKQRRKLQQTLAELGHGAIALHYLVTGERLRIILTTPQTQLLRDSAVTAPALRRAVSDYRAILTNPQRDPHPLGQQLYRWLLAPVAEDLKQAGAHTLMVAPDDVLRYLPFAALHDGEHYVAESLALALFTAAAGLDIKDRPSSRWRAAGLGVSRALGGHPPLPAVPGELEGIVRRGDADPDGVLPGMLALDEAFTAGRLEQALAARYPVLHISSHFVFRPGNVADSYLLLGDGSRLTLEAIREEELDFGPVELLTLSACDTAIGANGHGAEIESFGALAQNQGAKGVLATLWPVADASTGLFMQQMYRLREQNRLTKAEALRRTQLAFLDGTQAPDPAPESLRGAAPRAVTDAKTMQRFTLDPERPYAHPYYWAPFILMGNWL